MIFKVIQYSIFSFIIIAVIHYLISHLTENLTTPQVRDLVHSTNDQYETIIKKLEGKITRAKKVDNYNTTYTNKTRHNKTLNTANEEMKESLKTYLKGLNHEKSTDGIGSGFGTVFGTGNGSGAGAGSVSGNTQLNSGNMLNEVSMFDNYDNTTMSNNDELAYSSY